MNKMDFRSPTAGTNLIPEQPLFAFQNGRMADIPMILGVVQNEGTLFVHEAFSKKMGRLEYGMSVQNFE